MLDSTPVLVALGLALHIFVGVIAGRVLARLTQFGASRPGQASQWTVYALGLLLMIVYGFAAGHLAKALRNHDAILVSFAVTMLLACLITYLRRRR